MIFYFVLLIVLFNNVLSVQYVDNHTADDDQSVYKVADYIGVYIAVFICAFPITFHIFDFIGLFDGLVSRLGKKAHETFLKEVNRPVHLKSGTITEEEFKIILKEYYEQHNPDKVYTIDKIVEAYEGWEQALIEQLEEKYQKPVNLTKEKVIVVDVADNSAVAENGDVPTTEEGADVKDKEGADVKDKEGDDTKYETICGREKVICGKKFPIMKYHGDFSKSLVNQRAYYDSYDNRRSDSCFCLASSLYSDAMFFFFNNHSMFSMAGAIQAHPFSRYNRRMAFIVRHGLAFLLSVAFYKLPIPEGGKAALNTVFITPLTIFVNTSVIITIL